MSTANCTDASDGTNKNNESFVKELNECRQYREDDQKSVRFIAYFFTTGHELVTEKMKGQQTLFKTSEEVVRSQFYDYWALVFAERIRWSEKEKRTKIIWTDDDLERLRICIHEGAPVPNDAEILVPLVYIRSRDNLIQLAKEHCDGHAQSASFDFSDYSSGIKKLKEIAEYCREKGIETGELADLRRRFFTKACQSCFRSGLHWFSFEKNPSPELALLKEAETMMKRIEECFAEGADPNGIDREQYSVWRKELCAALSKAIPEEIKKKMLKIAQRLKDVNRYALEGGNPKDGVEVLITSQWLASICNLLQA